MSRLPSNATLDLDCLDALLLRALVFNHIHDAVIVTNGDGIIVDWNSGAERIFGWRREEVLGSSTEILWTPDEAPALARERAESLASLGKWVAEFVFLRRDGTTGRCEAISVPLLDGAGQSLGILSVYTEFAEPSPAGEDAIEPEIPPRPSNALVTDERFLLRSLIDAVPDPIFCKDREGRYLLHNLADQLMFDTDGSEHLGKTVFELPGLRKYAARYHADDMKVMRTGRPVINREEPFERPDGTGGWFLTSKFPLRDETNKIIGLVGIARDITGMKQAREELQEARSRLVDHVENSPLAVIECDPSFRILRWAGQAATTFGWTAEEVVGKQLTDWTFVHPDDAAKVSEIGARLADGRDQRNVSHHRNLTKSGRVVHCLWQNSVLVDRTGRTTSILSLVQDITDRVLAEQSSRNRKSSKAWACSRAALPTISTTCSRECLATRASRGWIWRPTHQCRPTWRRSKHPRRARPSCASKCWPTRARAGLW
jgi:PAS domain S-box-containing protein